MTDSYKVLESSSLNATDFDADEVGGKKIPRMKPVWGANGAANDISAATPMPITQDLPLDGDALGVGTEPVFPSAGVYQASRSALIDGDLGVPALTSNRALYITPETPNGNSMVDETLDAMKVSVLNLPYLEGDVDVSISGVPVLWEDTSDVLRVPSATKPLPVNVISSIVVGTEYTEGATDATITGKAILWEDTGDALVTVSAAKPLPIEVVSGVTNGTEYTEGDMDATLVGSVILWEDALDTVTPVSVVKPLPVSVITALAAGTNNIGDVDILTLPAIPEGDNNIGNVDIVTLPALVAGTANIGDVDVLTLPVDPLGASADAAITTDTTGSISGKLRGLVKHAYERMPASLGAKTSANSFPVVLASDQSAVSVDAASVVPGTGATNLGKAEDAGHSSGDTGVMILAVRQDTMAALAGTTGDYIPLTTDSSGRLRVVNHGVQRSLTWATGTVASSGSNTIVAAPSAGNHLTVKYLQQQNETANATTAIWEDGTTDKIRSYNTGAGSGATWQFEDGSEWRLTSATALQLNLSATNSHGYTVGYWVEAD